MHPDLPTPYEKGNQNQTTTWSECITFYEASGTALPHVLRFRTDRPSDGGIRCTPAWSAPTACMTAPRSRRRAHRVLQQQRHPPGRTRRRGRLHGHRARPVLRAGPLAALGKTVLLFVPLYNVDGA
jgi:hypothetical protein